MPDKFKVGDPVKWVKHGKENRGKISFVIPENKSPLDVVSMDSLRETNTKPIGLISGATPRNHESYFVEATVGPRDMKVLYWPQTSVLKKAE